MKRRTIALLMALLLCVSLVTACSNEDKQDTSLEDTDEEEMVSNEADKDATGRAVPFENSKTIKNDDIEGTTVDNPISENTAGDSSEYPLYFMTTSNEESIELTFFDEEKEIPYISMEETGRLLGLIGSYDGYPSSFDIEYTEDGNKAVLTRETGYTMVADPDEDTITFYDYDAFIAAPGAIRLIQMVSQRNDNEDFGSLFKHSDYSYQRYGDMIVLELGKYNIDILKNDKGCFIPLATVSDFLVSPKYYNLLYNGESVIVLAYNSLYD